VGQIYEFSGTSVGPPQWAAIDGYSAGPGWDAVTGLGTPDVAHLLRVLRPARW